MSRPGYPSFTNLLYAIPITGRPLPPEIMFAFHAMAMPMNYNNIMQTVKGMPVADAREHFGKMAEANNCKYIFFWDEDVACPPQTIPELIYKMEHHPDIAVCGGVYCLKRDPAEPLVFMGNGNGPFWDWKAGEFFECTGIGMGCAVIRVEALKDLKRPWFKTVSDYSKMLDGFACMESWTEDLWFCKRITDTGKWKVYCDGSLLATHYDLATGKAYNLPPDSKPVKHMNMPKGSKKILDIGSGVNPNGEHYKCDEGKVITCDFDYVTCDTDYRCDLRKLPFETGEFDIAFSNALEMFSSLDALDALKEWKRILKPKGELRLVVEDIDVVMQGIQQGKLDPERLYHFADRYDKKSSFSYRTLCAALERAGFNNGDIGRVPSDDMHIGVRAIN